MRNKLLATVAMTALIGCTSFAVAQNAGTQGGTMQSPGAQQQHQTGGPSGSAQNEAAPSKATPKGEQGKSVSQENKKGEQGKNFSQENKSQSGPKGEQGKTFSQEERTKSGAQGSAQEQRGSPTQRGAQEQRGKEEQRGAQMQREERGAQEQRGKEEQRGAQMQREERGAQDKERTQERMGQDQERGKTFQGQAQQGGGVTTGRSGRASVQLSEEQRTKIKDVIVRDRNVARVNSASFSVSVGARVPRDVHVTVLPPEVVRIVPEYRGFDYVLVGDQLLIIDPDTMEIVAILPA